ncbi:hypothetical protein LTR56_022666 [Elasticomyces elasticus]|nr:hypothetical protein LTR56_022666 [Elasticomyces elasticus]KAK3636915.1 hypothetical protein LTR22_018542 [Elasticomyces elasticus]KAK4901944.1 hypothetical protein LTR49_027146 [Elasticomyces elasticus]KAK5736479.1 hypothetical protein LTS12_026170 [Elasticomyces elasticus]
MAPPKSKMPLAKRLGALYALLTKSSDAIASSSPEAVLAKLLEILKQASPALRLAITFSTPIILLYSALSKYGAVVYSFMALKRYISSKVTSQIKIGASHPLQRQVMAWLAQHALKDAHTLALADSADTQSSRQLSRFAMIYGEEAVKPNNSDEDDKKEDLVYVPDIGSYTFWYGGYKMRFERRVHSTPTATASGLTVPAQEQDTIVLSCLSFFAGATPLQRFLEHVKNSNVDADQAMTKIFRPATAAARHNPYSLGAQSTYTMGWDSGISRPKRKLDAVTLDSKIQVPLQKDLSDYLNPKTKQFYIQNGIPYRRGILMYGPPGTGKTSFAAALAGEYGLNVYLLNLTSNKLTDHTLEELFEQLPSKCIVLLEDIDSAGVKREDMRAPVKRVKLSKRKGRMMTPDAGMQPGLFSNAGATMMSTISAQRSGVTLSGLLNVLDGVRAAEGRILLLTSNNPDSLDKALVRPGRIDKKVLFGNASHEVATKMFTRIFSKSPQQLLEGEQRFDNIADLAKQFADQIPLDTVSPALIQCHLLGHRTDPNAALAATPLFVADILEEKRRGTNVANFEAGLGARPETQERADSPASSAESRKTSQDLGDESTEESEETDEEDDEEDLSEVMGLEMA